MVDKQKKELTEERIREIVREEITRGFQAYILLSRKMANWDSDPLTNWTMERIQELQRGVLYRDEQTRLAK